MANGTEDPDASAQTGANAEVGPSDGVPRYDNRPEIRTRAMNQRAEDETAKSQDDRGEEDEELLTVIVPCLDEVGNVRSTADSILDTAPELEVDVEIFFIDDGSSDGTLEVMEEICEEHPGCRIMVNDENLGLGSSVLKAYERIDGDSWATVIPGDNEFVFASIKNFLAIREGYDVILGYLKNPVIRGFIRRMASDAFTEIANLLYGFSFRYFNGMKMYRVKCFKGIETVSEGHAFNPELLAKAMLRNPDLRIGEAPFVIKGRDEGESKAFTPEAIMQAILDLYRGYQAVIDYRENVVQDRDEEKLREMFEDAHL